MPSHGSDLSVPGGQTFDQLIANNAALTALTAYLSNQGELPTNITINNNAEPPVGAPLNPAFVNPTTGSLTWNTGDVQRAIDSYGASAAQILWGEFEHIYYTDGPFSTTGGPQSIAATIDNTTYVWQIYSIDANGVATFNVAGISGAEHLLSHDDALAAGSFGSDQGNFLMQALTDAGVPIATAAQIAANHANDSITASPSNGNPVQSVPLTTTCAPATTTSSIRRHAQSTGRKIQGSATFVERW